MAVLVLDSTLKTIKASIASTSASVVFTSHYGDSNGTTFANGENDGTFATSPQEIVAAPSSGYQRTIKYITIQNGSGSAATVTVYLDNNGSARNIAVVTLNPGDTWSTDGTFDNTGSFKQVLGTINVTTVTGTLPVGNGGTGTTTLTANNVILGNGTSAVQFVAPGSTGNVLTSNGTTWSSSAPAAGVSTISFNTTGLTPNTATSGAVTVAGTLVVGNGGTGLNTTTAYGLIAAGTTATGAFQQVSGTGTSGQVLTSNGAGALPSWQAAGGGGITTGKAIAMAMIFGF